MPKELKLKGQAKRRNAPHPLGELPPKLAVSIGKDIIHRIAIGHADIDGDDFGGIFANAISGLHRKKPLGIADVTWESCAWSVKTIKANKPFTQKVVRLITGRNSVAYSAGIKDAFADVQATGAAVLNIWNARVNESLNQHDDLRIFVMLRNMSSLEFTLFEYEAVRYIAANYHWELNKQRNFEGVDKVTGGHVFTWQPHGSQFTVLHHVPPSAYRFRINKMPTILEERHVLQLVNFRDDWIVPVDAP
ncbi:MAG: hypothetical protein WA584_02380 [Pyrinomonadaceae bacterium]